MKKILKKIKIGQKQDIIKVEESNMKYLKKTEIEKILNDYSNNGEKYKKNKAILEKIYAKTNQKHRLNPSKYQYISDYRAGCYRDINSNCRKIIKNGKLDRKTNKIKKEIKQVPKIPDDMIMFRFIDRKEYEIIEKIYKKGKLYKRNGFTSGSLCSDFPTSMEFEILTKNKYTMIIEVPRGTEAIYFEDSMENEVLIQKNSYMQINDIIYCLNRKILIFAKIKKIP